MLMQQIVTKRFQLKVLKATVFKFYLLYDFHSFLLPFMAHAILLV